MNLLTDFEPYACHAKVLISLFHVKQSRSWDCGLCCVMMILSEEDRRYLMRNFDLVCEEEGINKSTWTIDLVYLLRRFGVKHRYCTTTLGVNPGYSSEVFYANVLGKDRERVVERFKEPSKNGVVVVERSVDFREVLTHLNGGDPLIVLVDANLLSCDSCGHSDSQPPSPRPYQGHYVVLVGFNLSTRRLFYRNPGGVHVEGKVCSVSFAGFERARKSFGTDEDIVFVFRDHRESLP